MNRGGLWTGLTAVVMSLMVAAGSLFAAPVQVQAEEDPQAAAMTAAAMKNDAFRTQHAQAQAAHPGTTVIVLDPGHGGPGPEGADLGATYEPYHEKDLTLQVALAMYQELSQYDNVVVYLTRTDDTSVSLADRVALAQAAKADFLFSIHFNARAEHDFYGSEVEISAFGDAYACGATFADLELQQLQALGLYARGPKTRLNSAQNADYYGIIWRATAAGIPAVITEHCFLDTEPDRTFLSRPDALAQLAHADVTALAEYLHLKSTALGVDYTQYTYAQVPAPAGGFVRDDTTPPELNVITSAVYDDAAGEAVVSFSAQDPESAIVYCSYSLDGGATWSQLFPYDSARKDVTVRIPGRRGQQVAIRVWNMFNYYTTSAPVTIR